MSAYTSQTPLSGAGRGNPAHISDWAIQRGAMRELDLRLYVETVYRLSPALGINPDVVIAQWLVETSDRPTGRIPGVSVPWVYGLNPCGLGVTDDSQWRIYDFGTGDRAARAHLLHLSLYVNGATVPTGFATTDDPRWQAAIDAGYVGIADTLEDLSNRWALDPQYGSKIADRLNQMDAAGLLERTEPVALKPYTVPGLKNPLYLPDDIRVEIKLITHPRFRSFQKSTAQTTTTWHDTGETGGNADGEWSWANGGRQGGVVGGYNAIIDDDQIIICQPFDEVVWHAGVDLGNRTSYGAEQCREGVNRAKAIRNAAAFHGAICAARGWQVDTALIQHHAWYGKECPSYIRENGLWSSAVKQASEFAALSRAAMGGSPGPTPVPAPTYVKPAIIPELDAISSGAGFAPAFVKVKGVTWVWVGDRVQVTKQTGRYQYGSKDSARIGPDLKVGESLDVDWLAADAEVPVYYTPYATRIIQADTKRISDTKGEQAA